MVGCDDSDIERQIPCLLKYATENIPSFKPGSSRTAGRAACVTHFGMWHYLMTATYQVSRSTQEVLIGNA